MASTTSIEWTQATWNPVTGCTKISVGCRHCYAERLAHRLKRMANARYTREFEVTLHHDLVDLPLSWRRPKHIFVNSMSDLFHEDIPLSYILSVFSTMRAADWHQFQILTKRADRLFQLAPRIQWPDNVWMGVTVESQDLAWRIERLRHVSAPIRFVSCEPLLGPLQIDLTGIDWIIVGGESGPGARSMNMDWVRSLRDQCLHAGVPFFLKQLGGPIDKRGKGKALVDGLKWQQVPQSRLEKALAFRSAALAAVHSV